MSKFKGTGVAVITPFHSDLSVDFESLTRIINHLIQNGIEYLVALGSTAEAATLTDAEKTQIAAHFVSVNNGRVPLVIGIGGNHTQALIEELQYRDLTGFDAVLSVSPAYNKPSQEGLYQHFKALAAASPIPIILYNVPGRTAKNMEPKTVVRLAQDFKNIIGIKEAAGDMAQSLELLRTKPDDFDIISGDDMLALPMTLAGGAGVISVIGQGLPRAFSDAIRLGLAGNAKEAYALHYKLMPAIDMIFAEGNPAGIKAMLAHQGFCENVLRLPLTPVSNQLNEAIISFH
jgi:4-hydroxy-tetrahydrodipicolinate synthase